MYKIFFKGYKFARTYGQLSYDLSHVFVNEGDDIYPMPKSGYTGEPMFKTFGLHFGNTIGSALMRWFGGPKASVFTVEVCEDRSATAYTHYNDHMWTGIAAHLRVTSPVVNLDKDDWRLFLARYGQLCNYDSFSGFSYSKNFEGMYRYWAEHNNNLACWIRLYHLDKVDIALEELFQEKLNELAH